MLEKKGVNVIAYDHFIDGKENILHTMLNEMNEELEAKETAKKPKGNEIVGWGYFGEKVEEKKRRRKNASLKNWDASISSFSMIWGAT